MNVLKDPAMLKRLNDIQSFPEKEREHILYTIDALIKNVKLKTISEWKSPEHAGLIVKNLYVGFSLWDLLDTSKYQKAWAEPKLK